MSVIDRVIHPSTASQGHYSWQTNLQGVFYGPGSIKAALPELLETLKIKKALIVTTRSVFFKTDIAKRIQDVLQEHNAYGATFYEVQQYSPIADIKAGIRVYEANDCDGVVAVGGGSCIDAVKTMTYLYQKEKGGRTPYQIAIPTTLSAAENQMGAGYTDEEGNKVAVSSPELTPGGIVLDAELTLATPERLWLSTGIKALDHAVENLYRSQVTPPVKVLGYYAISELFKYLPLSKAHPDSVEIRQKLQLASWMSLWPMKLKTYTALGISHSLGHKLGARYGIPHGITSCLTLAPSVALQAHIATQEDKETLAAALAHIGETLTGSAERDILTFSSLIDQLVRDLGLHSTLSEYKVPREDFRKIAGSALGGDDHPEVEKVVLILEGMY